ncbi:MAG: O-antigen ligase family protein, partial [Chloroflexi bacterium]|nr:O-antigen ligase family protein [Chloroflexota bacterium]
MSLVVVWFRGVEYRFQVIIRPLIILISLVIIAYLLATLPLSQAIILIALALGGLGILWRPSLALYPLAFFIPWGGPEISFGGFQAGLTELLVWTAVGCWLMHMLAWRRLKWQEKSLWLPLVLFIGALFLSWWPARDLTLAIKETFKWLEVLGLYGLITTEVSRREVPWLVIALLLAGLTQAALGGYQFFFLDGPPAFLISGGRFLRAYGSFQQPNPYAGYIGTVLPLAYALAVSPFFWRMRQDAGPRQQELSGSAGSLLAGTTSLDFGRMLLWLSGCISLVALGAALVFSQSRGAWLGFAVAFVAMNASVSRRWAILFVLLLAAGILGTLFNSADLLPPFMAGRLAPVLPYAGIPDVSGVEITDANFGIVERLAHWQAAWGMIAAAPWTGIGAGNYPVAYAGFALPRWTDPLGHAHNYYLNIWAEAGLPGLVTFLLLVIAMFRVALSAVQRKSSSISLAIALGTVGMLVAVSIHNLFDSLFVHNLYLQMAILLGL